MQCKKDPKFATNEDQAASRRSHNRKKHAELATSTRTVLGQVEAKGEAPKAPAANLCCLVSCALANNNQAGFSCKDPTSEQGV